MVTAVRRVARRAADRLAEGASRPGRPGGPPRRHESPARSRSRRRPVWIASRDEEYERFHRLNAAYRETFGFPFIIAVRGHDKTGILAAFERRLGHTREQEIEAALAQVAEIAWLRLDALVARRDGGVDGAPPHHPRPRHGSRPCPRRGCASTSRRSTPTAARASLTTATTNADGRTDAPLLAGDDAEGRALRDRVPRRRLLPARRGRRRPIRRSWTSSPCASPSPTLRATTTCPSSSRPGATRPIEGADVRSRSGRRAPGS